MSQFENCVFFPILQQDTVLPKSKRDVTLIKSMDQIGEWVEDNRRVFFHQFKGGLNQTYVQMIPLNRFEHYQVGNFHINQLQFTILTEHFSLQQFVNVEAINIDTDDWIFGCNAIEMHDYQKYW